MCICSIYIHFVCCRWWIWVSAVANCVVVSLARLAAPTGHPSTSSPPPSPAAADNNPQAPAGLVDVLQRTVHAFTAKYWSLFPPQKYVIEHCSGYDHIRDYVTTWKQTKWCLFLVILLRIALLNASSSSIVTFLQASSLVNTSVLHSSHTTLRCLPFPATTEFPRGFSARLQPSVMLVTLQETGIIWSVSM